ncbi:MAG: hypothetical protein LC635_00575 [Pseudonocardiaceae bacterium]|nr:hypothetical protein [Pseudonocardiaceae bacterium]
MLEKISWDPRSPLSTDAATEPLHDTTLIFSAELDGEQFGLLQASALQVWAVPANPRFPARGLPRKVGVTGNVLNLDVQLDQQSRTELKESGGGVILIDLVCDALLDRNGRPVSSSSGVVLFGGTQFPVPGGLLRLGMPVRDRQG